jgi:hypothetical protein
MGLSFGWTDDVEVMDADARIATVFIPSESRVAAQAVTGPDFERERTARALRHELELLVDHHGDAVAREPPTNIRSDGIADELHGARSGVSHVRQSPGH